MSRSITSRGTALSRRSQSQIAGFSQNPRRIGVSGLLVTKARRRCGSGTRRRARRCRCWRATLSLSAQSPSLSGRQGDRCYASVGQLGKGRGTKAHPASPRPPWNSGRSSHGNCCISAVIWKDSYNAVQIRTEGRIGTRSGQCLYIDLSIFYYHLVISIS